VAKKVSNPAPPVSSKPVAPPTPPPLGDKGSTMTTDEFARLFRQAMREGKLK